MATRYIVIGKCQSYFYFLTGISAWTNHISHAKTYESYDEAKSCADWYTNMTHDTGGILPEKMVVSADMHPEDRYAD